MIKCPKCNGPMYDNRKTKKNERQPDFKCKNKAGCDHAIWPDSKDYPTDADNAPAPNGKPSPGNPVQSVATETVGQFLKRAAKLLSMCHDAARSALKQSYEGEDGRSLFIETNRAQRDGYVSNEAAFPVADTETDLEAGEGVDL